jgi:hypothetical protein
VEHADRLELQRDLPELLRGALELPHHLRGIVGLEERQGDVGPVVEVQEGRETPALPRVSMSSKSLSSVASSKTNSMAYRMALPHPLLDR